MARIHTFRSIAEVTGKEKRTVQMWHARHKTETGEELGEIRPADGARVFSDEERDTLVKYGRDAIADQVSVKPADIVPFETVALGKNDFDINAALSRLDGAKGQVLENSAVVVDLAEMLFQRLEGALNSKIGQQQQQVSKDEQQLWRLQALKKDFDRKTAIARQSSKSLAQEQSAVTSDLQEMFQEVLDLGKADS